MGISYPKIVKIRKPEMQSYKEVRPGICGCNRVTDAGNQSGRIGKAHACDKGNENPLRSAGTINGDSLKSYP